MDVSFGIILSLLHFVNAFLTHVAAQQSDFGYCADFGCTVPIAEGVAVMNYRGPDHDRLELQTNDKFQIYARDAGPKKHLLGIIKNGQKGFVPKNFVKEVRTLQRSLVEAAGNFRELPFNPDAMYGRAQASETHQHTSRDAGSDVTGNIQPSQQQFPPDFQSPGTHWQGESSQGHAQSHIHDSTSHIQASFGFPDPNTHQQHIGSDAASHSHVIPSSNSPDNFISSQDQFVPSSGGFEFQSQQFSNNLQPSSQLGSSLSQTIISNEMVIVFDTESHPVKRGSNSQHSTGGEFDGQHSHSSQLNAQSTQDVDPTLAILLQQGLTNEYNEYIGQKNTLSHPSQDEFLGGVDPNTAYQHSNPSASQFVYSTNIDGTNSLKDHSQKQSTFIPIEVYSIIDSASEDASHPSDGSQPGFGSQYEGQSSFPSGHAGSQSEYNTQFNGQTNLPGGLASSHLGHDTQFSGQTNLPGGQAGSQPGYDSHFGSQSGLPGQQTSHHSVSSNGLNTPSGDESRYSDLHNDQSGQFVHNREFSQRRGVQMPSESQLELTPSELNVPPEGNSMHHRNIDGTLSGHHEFQAQDSQTLESTGTNTRTSSDGVELSGSMLKLSSEFDASSKQPDTQFPQGQDSSASVRSDSPPLESSRDVHQTNDHGFNVVLDSSTLTTSLETGTVSSEISSSETKSDENSEIVDTPLDSFEEEQDDEGDEEDDEGDVEAEVESEEIEEEERDIKPISVPEEKKNIENSKTVDSDNISPTSTSGDATVVNARHSIFLEHIKSSINTDFSFAEDNVTADASIVNDSLTKTEPVSSLNVDGDDNLVVSEKAEKGTPGSSLINSIFPSSSSNGNEESLNLYQTRHLKGDESHVDNKEETSEESGNTSYSDFDIYEYFENILEAIRSFSELVLEWTPEPLYSVLMDLKIQGISPKVPVFTAICAIPCISLIIAVVLIKERSKERKLLAQLVVVEKNAYTATAEKCVLEENIGKLESELLDSQSTMDSERKIHTGMKLEIEKLKQQLEQSAFEVESSNEEVDALRGREKEYQELVSDHEKVHLELMEEKNDLEIRLSEHEDTICRLNEQLQDEEKELSQVKEERMQFVQCNEIYEEKVTNLQQNCNQLLKEADAWNSRVSDLEGKLEEASSSLTEMEHILKEKESEIESLTLVVQTFKSFEEMEDTDDTEYKSKEEKVQYLKNSANVLIKLQDKEDEIKLLREKLDGEINKLLDLEVELLDSKSENDKMKISYNHALQDKAEAQTKLEVLSNYFKDKEIQLQKQLGAQEMVREKKEKDADSAERRIILIEQENTSYKSQVASMKQEMEETERNLKSQIAAQEKKAHENWIAARAAERKLDDMKQEVTQLRQKLTLLEREQENLANSAQDDVLRPIPKRMGGMNDDTVNSQELNDTYDQYNMPRFPLLLPHGMPPDRPLPPMPPFDPPPMFPPPPHFPFPPEPHFGPPPMHPDFVRRPPSPPRGRHPGIDNEMGPRQSSPLSSEMRDSRNSTPPHSMSLPDFPDIPPRPPFFPPTGPPHPRYPLRPPFKPPQGPPRPDNQGDNRSLSRGSQQSANPPDNWSNSRV